MINYMVLLDKISIFTLKLYPKYMRYIQAERMFYKYLMIIGNLNENIELIQYLLIVDLYFLFL